LKYARDQNFKNLAYGMGMNEKGQFGEYKDGAFTQYQERFHDFISGEVHWKDADYNKLASIATGSNP